MKAIGLVSGGLDGILAVRLIEGQGIEVVPVYFYFPFLRQNKPLICMIVDISEDFIRLLKKPRYGYGSNMNPCIDCRILMLRKAKELMPELGASFVLTGEVLGQRPMSQNKQSLLDIERDSGLEGLLLRPLSARLLPETIPEQNGWVDRNKLLDLNGRSRKQQLALAEKFNITDYFKTGGGCLLTEKLFVNKLKDLIKYNEFNISSIELLKIGRHFRLSDKAKLIVGRDKRENEQLFKIAGFHNEILRPLPLRCAQGQGPQDDGSENSPTSHLFKTIDIPGPVGLGRGIFDEALIRLCAGIICYYSDRDGQPNTEISYVKSGEQKEYILPISPIDNNRLEKLRI